MENTARIIKREGLDPPKKGIDDEIAYLDQVLFEIGNHIIELENFKKGLVAIVSHELRTPLMSVCSLLELLGAGVLGQLSERAQERLTIAEIEAVHLVRLINDLLDIEKMEAGQFILDKIEFKLVDIIEPTTAAVARLAEAKQVIMNLDGTNGDLKVWADRDRLCKALINLLSNGIESSPRNGTVNVSVQDTTAEIEFRVIDHGAGIPEEQQAKIFDRFVQVQTSDRCKYHRSGLSLAITRAIIEQHGGTIGVDSEIGTGNTFWFKLPLNQADFKSSPGVRDNTEPTAAAK
jgi:signal transduction histidine kinase